jgi:pimeloyl-ACP methyl ester carboxylesterase
MNGSTDCVPKQELHHMLTQNEVMVNIPPREGETVGNRTRVVPGDLGFVMVGHSLGSVYARRFAFLYPKLTSALVMWDAIPSQNTGPDKNEVRFDQGPERGNFVSTVLRQTSL